MKKLTLVLLLALGMMQSSFAQSSTLYVGFGYSDQVLLVDTTDGDYTIYDNLTLTSDIGSLTGCYGLSNDDDLDITYILYSSSLEESEGIRRIGTVDLTTGNVTDIGFVGSLTDISFVDGVLYGTTGSYYPSYSLVSIDVADATVTNLFEHAISTYGPAIGFDPYNDVMLKLDEDAYSETDLGTLTETVVAVTGHPGESHAILMKDETTALVLAYSELYEFNTATNTFTYITEFDADGVGQALVFGLPICEAPTVTGTTTDELLGADATISITVSGGFAPYVFDWDNDGTGDFDDTEDLSGLTAGTYTVQVKDSIGCTQTMTFVIDSQVKIEELDQALVALYPNPSSDVITIELAGVFTYELVALNGELMRSGSGSDIETISLKELANGTYFIRLKTADKSTQLKIVKQ